MEKIPIIVAKFANEIQHKDISAFRIALLDYLLLKGCNLNNYSKKIDESSYAYPLIQIKRIKNKATLFAIAEGTKHISYFIKASDFECFFKENNEKIMLESIKEDKCDMKIVENCYSYSIRRYLPFNTESKERYNKIITRSNKKLFLENMLVANIKNFSESIGVEFDDKIVVMIDSITETGVKFYRRLSYDSFDISFRSNISIPNYAGLGKIVSHGFGLVVRIDNKETEN
jgi:hypothetical protein